MVGVKLKILVSMCLFPVDSEFDRSIGFPGNKGVQKWDGAFAFLFICELNATGGVDGSEGSEGGEST